MIKEDSPVTEERCILESVGEPYVALHSVCWERLMDQWDSKTAGVEPGTDSFTNAIGTKRELTFVPYYFRANRGGKGNMRVALQRA
jgi:hypothetical protein